MTEFVYGVDVAVSRLAIGFAPVDGGRPHAVTLTVRTEDREGARLGLLDRQLRLAAQRWAAEWPPACCFVEQPSGRFRNLPLTYATGVVMSALSEALGCPVWSVPSSKWKKATIGAGNATKEQIHAWVDRMGVGAGSQDEADAIAIACAGRAMLLERSWEAVA